MATITARGNFEVSRWGRDGTTLVLRSDGKVLRRTGLSGYTILGTWKGWLPEYRKAVRPTARVPKATQERARTALIEHLERYTEFLASNGWTRKFVIQGKYGRARVYGLVGF